MPHGFKCDRCQEFIEQRRRCREREARIDGPTVVESVTVDHPHDGVEEFTLCEDCRHILIVDFVGRGSS